MAKVKIVTAYVPLRGFKTTPAQYKELGASLAAAVPNIRVFDDYPLIACWMHKFLEPYRPVYPAADWVPDDRFIDEQHMVEFNIVHSQKVEWMKLAAAEDPEPDVFVWLDYGIMKQGGFTGKPVTARIISDFVATVARRAPKVITIPGCWPQGPIPYNTISWRFCGSTLICPRELLFSFAGAVKGEAKRFTRQTGLVTFDTNLWAAVEFQERLPFRWYEANHDATQLSNY